MKHLLVIVFLFNYFALYGQPKLNIVPAPAELQYTGKSFDYDLPIQIVHTKNKEAVFNAMFLMKELQKKGIVCKLVDHEHFNTQQSKILLINEEAVSEGAYTIHIPGKDIIINGSDHAVFYGIQTLLQIMPDANPNTKNKKITLPNITISDFPRFQYRGVHLDVGRHFFPIDFIKKYIDYLAAYKYNVFHWHLTEDQGWRIEIKKYPALTKTGGFRNGTIVGRYPGKGSDNKPYGGFYTQAEIKEVVQYAKDRYIEVIPEIEMPGHSSAAIAAYPWLSCFPAKPTAIPANMISKKSMDEQKAGRVKLVQETWGVFDDVFCAGKDSTFKFLEQVIDEVNSLFPSKYFHLGADECPKTHWKICAACQQRMKDNNLKDEHELQSWFVQRIEKYLNQKGKILIGWDEILEGGLAPNAVVMSWRGEAGGIEAAKQKHRVIMTPGNPVYFDHSQSKNEDSITIGGYNSLEAVYAYEPIPKELNAEQGQYVMGAQANLWTEYMEYPSKVEYMLFPRMIALSEVLWSPKDKRDWKDFESRLPFIFSKLEKNKVNFSKAYYDLKASILPAPNYQGVVLKVESKITGAKIFWTPSLESSYSGVYTEPLLITENTKRIFTLVDGDNKTLSSVTQSINFNKATGKKIILSNEPSKSYPGDGAFTLVNGVQNEKGMSKSSEFLGFNGTDLNATIDLGTLTDVHTITLHVLDQQGSWIYLPSQVEVTFIPDTDYAEADLKKFPSTIKTINPLADKGAKTITIENKQKCRYLQVKAKNYGIIPTGNPGAGNKAWLFVDEIEVQ